MAGGKAYSCTGDAERENVCLERVAGLTRFLREEKLRVTNFIHAYIIHMYTYLYIIFCSLSPFSRDFLLSCYSSLVFFFFFFFNYIIGQKKEAACSITPLDYSTLSYYACYLELLDLSALYFGITRLKTRIVLSRIISINSYVTSREASFYDALATINYQQHARL